MGNLKDYIIKLVPFAEWEEGQVLTVKVNPGDFRLLAVHLRNDEELQFDYLLCMTGMDWGEELGVV